MTPTDAVANISALFTVHDERGHPADWVDQNDKVVGSGARDMNTAPNGEPYEVLTSYGAGAKLPADALVMFQSERLALQWWYDEVKAWAEELQPDHSKWLRLHLYWRDKPVFHKATYLVMNQAELLGTASPLAAVHSIDLGFVWSRLLISKVGPDGEED
jgi:hypothetical protein